MERMGKGKQQGPKKRGMIQGNGNRRGLIGGGVEAPMSGKSMSSQAPA